MIRRWLAARRERKLHRRTAFNCRYWTGDAVDVSRPGVDWGTCPRCPEQP